MLSSTTNSFGIAIHIALAIPHVVSMRILFQSDSISEASYRIFVRVSAYIGVQASTAHEPNTNSAKILYLLQNMHPFMPKEARVWVRQHC